MGVELTERDIFKDPLSAADLLGLAEIRPLRELFSFRSPSFRKLGINAESVTDDEMLSMMLEEPRLIRRPLVLADGRIIIGNDTAEFERIFG